MSQEQRIRIRFPELSALEAGRAAQKLKTLIQAAHDKKPAGTLSLDVARSREDAQSVGEILVVLFGTSAALAIAQGVRTYIAAKGSQVTIETLDAKIVATGDAAKNIDVAETVEKLRGLQPAPAAVKAELKVVDETPPSLPKKSAQPSLPDKASPKGAAKQKSIKSPDSAGAARSKRK